MPAQWCWLCGAGIERGWPLSEALAPTFTQHNEARCSDSGAICAPCVAILDGAVFKDMVRARDVRDPRGDPLKLWSQCGWHSYSHYIHERGVYEAPNPARMRELLCDPLPGKWLMGVNTTGKKHTIFRAEVCDGSDICVQIDEARIRLSRADFVRVLAAVEAALEAGASRDEIRTGLWHPETLRRAGMKAFRRVSDELAFWRARSPGGMHLACIVGQRQTPQKAGPGTANEHRDGDQMELL